MEYINQNLYLCVKLVYEKKLKVTIKFSFFKS